MTTVSIDVPPSGPPVVFDAGTGSFVFTDNVSVNTNVIINNFGPDDVIQVTGIANPDVYAYGSDGTVVSIGFNETGQFTAIDINPVGDLIPGDFVTNHASAGAALGNANFLVIAGANAAPVFTAGASVNESTPQNTPLADSVPATDANGDTLTYSLLGPQPANGNVVVNSANGNYTYTPNAGFTGNNSFVVQVSDGNGGTDTITVNVSVTAVVTPTIVSIDVPPSGPPVVFDAGTGALIFTDDLDVRTDVRIVNFGPDDVIRAIDLIDVSNPANGIDRDDYSYTTDSNGVIVEFSDGGTRFSSLHIDPVGDLAPGIVFNYAGAEAVLAHPDFLLLGPANTAPAFPVDSANAIATEDTVLNANLPVATDADGNTLTYSLQTQAAQGAVIVNANGSYSYTPAANYNGADSFVARVSDGNGGTDTVTINITVAAVNDAPTFPSDAVARVTSLDTSVVGILPAATDIDGDALTYSLLTGSANGTAVVNANGAWSFTPTAGFTGADSFVARVSDGNGGTDTLTVNVTVNPAPPSANNWNLLMTTGFAGSIGGTGKAFGATGFQDITVLDLPGTATLDGSFNQGGDIVRLAGNASDWQIKRVGTAALFSDGDTFVQIPAGTTGMTVVFADGVRLLRVDTGAATLKIGAQAFGTDYVQITAAADGSPLPTGANASAAATITLLPDGSVAAAGKLSIFGTGLGDETVHLLSGNATLDASFNGGGDLVTLDPVASAFMANRVGTQVFLDSATTDVTIPVGTAGMNLAFGGGADTRLLLIDTNIPAIVIDAQQIGFTPVALIA